MISTRVSLSGSAPDDNASQYPDMGLPGIANQGAFLSQQGRFLDALAQSDPGYQPGAKLSTELHRQACIWPGWNRTTFKWVRTPVSPG